MYSVFEEIPKGWRGGGGVTSKMGNPGGVGGSYMKFPPWWGHGYFLEPHIFEVSLHVGIQSRKILIYTTKLQVCLLCLSLPPPPLST